MRAKMRTVFKTYIRFDHIVLPPLKKNLACFVFGGPKIKKTTVRSRPP